MSANVNGGSVAEDTTSSKRSFWRAFAVGAIVLGITAIGLSRHESPSTKSQQVQASSPSTNLDLVVAEITTSDAQPTAQSNDDENVQPTNQEAVSQGADTSVAVPQAQQVHPIMGLLVRHKFAIIISVVVVVVALLIAGGVSFGVLYMQDAANQELVESTLRSELERHEAAWHERLEAERIRSEAEAEAERQMYVDDTVNSIQRAAQDNEAREFTAGEIVGLVILAIVIIFGTGYQRYSSRIVFQH